MHVDGSIVTVPPRFTRDAVFEAIEAGVKLIVVVSASRGEVAQMVELAGLRGARIIGRTVSARSRLTSESAASTARP
jgi:succinyl-CoA synthetase alpha subunit